MRRRKQREDDLARELRAHLDLEAEEQQRAGMAPDDACYAALRAFGHQIIIEEDTRAMWHSISIEKMGQDLWYAGRMARKNPFFTALAILILALGIGANTAIFSVVNTVLLKPLPYRDASRLVRIWTRNDPLHVRSGPASYPDFTDWKASGTFADMGIYFIGDSIVRIGNGSERVPSGAATASLFSTLGVRPLLGRLPLPEEDSPGASPVTLLTEGLWRRRFGADPAVIGRSLEIDAKPSVVVGILPASFVFERAPEMWTTFEKDGDLMERENRYLAVLARLRPGESLEQADSRLSALCSHLSAQYPVDDKDWSANAFPLQESQVGPFRVELLVLLGAVSLVLLICCGNVAMLLLVRGAGRLREIGLRTALGASRLRIAVQLLTENLLLSIAGGALGVALAAWCVASIVRYGPRDIPRLAEVHMDARVLLFALAVSFFMTLLFGLGPALQLSRPDVNAALQEGGKSATLGRRRAVLRSCLLAGEMALSLVLLAGAGLLVKSFLRLASVAPGFRTDHLLTFQLAMPSTKFLSAGQYMENRVASYYSQVMDRLRRLPQVEAVGGTMDIPMAGGGVRPWQDFAVPGNPATAIKKTICVFLAVTPDYFRALGVPLKLGRTFNDRENKAGTPVAIVNETFARRYLAGRNPLGASVEHRGIPALRQIVGVVAI